jgi:hypothetical protein
MQLWHAHGRVYRPLSRTGLPLSYAPGAPCQRSKPKLLRRAFPARGRPCYD